MNKLECSQLSITRQLSAISVAILVIVSGTNAIFELRRAICQSNS